MTPKRSTVYRALSSSAERSASLFTFIKKYQRPVHCFDPRMEHAHPPAHQINKFPAARTGHVRAASRVARGALMRFGQPGSEQRSSLRLQIGSFS